MIRDPKRIHSICQRLAAAWSLLPDWRFGQLMSNIFANMRSDGKDPFFPEDDAMIAYIEEYIEKITGVALHE